MHALIGIATLIGLFFELFLLGDIFSKIFFKSIRENAILKPALGLAFVLVLSSVFYRAGVPLRFTGVLYLAISSAHLSIIAPKLLKERPNIRVRLKKIHLWYAVCAIMILLPPIVGGTNFQVFQGNEADHLSYQSISLSVNKYSYAALSNSTFEQLGLVNPTANIAIININKRPIVELVYVSLLKPLGVSLIDYSYYFLLLLLIIAFYSTLGYLRRTKKDPKGLGAFFISLILIGFWGQYILDLNAWSFLLAVPIFILLAFVIEKFQTKPTPNLAILMSALVYGLFASYPEAAVFWIFGLCLYLFLTLIQKIKISGWKTYRSLAIVPMVSGLMIFQYGYGAFNFFLGQTGVTTSSATSSWHLYFDAYLLGNNPNEQFGNINLLRTVPMGLLGLFSITPSQLQVNILTLVIFIVPVVAIIFYSFMMLFRKPKHHLTEPMFYVAVSCIIAAPFIYYISTLWALGKLVTFILFPILILYATQDDFFMGTSKIARIVSIIIIIVWSLTQLAFAVDRIIWSESKGIPHKRLPYISVGDPSLKASQNWKIPLAKIETCKVTAIQVSQPFQNLFLSMKLEDKNSNWIDLNPIATFFGGGEKIGYMKTPFSSYDCLITNEVIDGKFAFQFRQLTKPVPIIMKN